VFHVLHCRLCPMKRPSSQWQEGAWVILSYSPLPGLQYSDSNQTTCSDPVL
jgi:hypothetical protein